MAWKSRPLANSCPGWEVALRYILSGRPCRTRQPWRAMMRRSARDGTGWLELQCRMINGCWQPSPGKWEGSE
eukprot:1895083-Prorocentrum_lima.AAC.1